MKPAFLITVFVLVAAVASAQVPPTPPLTEEDLHAAYEQGDLTAAEYAELLEAFRSRDAADAQYRDQALPPPALPDAGLAATPRIGFARAPLQSRFNYQATTPLRGRSGESQILGLSPRSTHVDARLEITRTDRTPWRLRTARSVLRYRRTDLTVGAFDTRWTGGLLIGPAPAFLDKYPEFAQSLLNPERGRLSGAAVETEIHNTRLTALYSLRRDPSHTHSAVGLRVDYVLRGVTITPAWLHQALTRRDTRARFRADLAGLSLSRAAGNTTMQADLAASGRGAAAQATITTERESYDLDLRGWVVSSAFRHPLLAADGESDRESVAYPELGESLSSASTGERGLYSRLRFARNTIAVTHWREHPERPAALRLQLQRTQHLAGWRLAAEYYFFTRPDASVRAYRHESTVRIARAGFFALAKARVTRGPWSPFGPTGGRFQIGWRSGARGALHGRPALSVAYDDFDLNTARSGFWTVRFDQSLALRSHTDFALHLRWRTAYNDQPASLTLRFTLGGTL